jgi:hypothetical protein
VVVRDFTVYLGIHPRGVFKEPQLNPTKTNNKRNRGKRLGHSMLVPRLFKGISLEDKIFRGIKISMAVCDAQCSMVSPDTWV